MQNRTSSALATPHITLAHLHAGYGATPVLNDIHLEIAQGEFVALLGASGCGKTTLLRTIAGFAAPDAGAVLVNGQDITHSPPEKRGMALVFQSYALWPHMTVAQHIAYGLKLRRMPRAEIARRVAQLESMLGLTGLVFAVWIASATFAAISREMEQAPHPIGAGPWRTFIDISLPQALPGLMAAAIFVFLESLDEFTGSYFVGAPDVQMMPLMLYSAGAGGNYQIASITALVLLVPSIVFMLVVERFLKADVLARIGK